VVVYEYCELDIWDFGRRGRGEDSAMDLGQDRKLAMPYIGAVVEDVKLAS